MPLLSCENLTIAFGSEPVLENVTLRLEKGDRVCLVGRNGSGKSTLLKIISGALVADEGVVRVQTGVRLANLDQELPAGNRNSVYQAVADGLGELGDALTKYYELAHRMGTSTRPQDAVELNRLHNKLDALDGWSAGNRIEAILDRMGLPATRRLDELSGGWLKRVAIARALVREPEVLLLDEPTNHLDIPTIEWLESILIDFEGAMLFVTHDRSLTRNVATTIAELDRGRLEIWNHGYTKYLDRKEHRQVVEEKLDAAEDRKLAVEEKWIRQGIQARRTRNEGRVRALQKLRQERSERRARQGLARMEIDGYGKSGKLVKELVNVDFAHGDQVILEQFNLTIMRGDRIGILGPNGAGKSTLLKLILGKLEPQCGEVRSGTRLQVAYFDQMRAELDPEATVRETISEGKDFIEINGRSVHVIGYLGNFLFSPARCQSPVKVLSGGETNRLLLARLFSLPANLLVLDEPTNDLDMETLELLEDLLVEFEGTLLLVTHDREFLDNTVTSLLVFEKWMQGYRVRESVGGYSDWLHSGGRWDQMAAQDQSDESARAQSVGKQASVDRRDARSEARKKEKELARLPLRIEAIESRRAELEQTMGLPDFYTTHPGKVEVLAEYERLGTEVESLYNRWSELE